MANNLKALRENRGWTQEEAAVAMQTTRNMYVKLENGKRGLGVKWIVRAADAYDIDPGEVVSNRSSDTVQIIGFVGAGSDAHFYSEAQGPFDEVAAPKGATDDTVAVEIRGDSLGSFFNGWIAFYDNVRRPMSADLIGQLCVVGLPDGRVLIKRIERSKAGRGLYHLISQVGAEPILDVPIEWAAKVRWMAAKT